MHSWPRMNNNQPGGQEKGKPSPGIFPHNYYMVGRLWGVTFSTAVLFQQPLAGAPCPRMRNCQLLLLHLFKQFFLNPRIIHIFRPDDPLL